MELPNGQQCRRVTDEAMGAAMIKQQEQQLIDHYYVLATSISTAVVDQVMNEGVVRIIDNTRQLLAKAYGSKAQEARVYAQQVAEEDAAIASQKIHIGFCQRVLLPVVPRVEGIRGCRKVPSTISSTAGPNVAAGIAKSFRRTDSVPHRRCIVSMQA